MIEDVHFLRETVVDIHSEVVAVSSGRGFKAGPKSSVDEAIVVMPNRFDVPFRRG